MLHFLSGVMSESRAALGVPALAHGAVALPAPRPALLREDGTTPLIGPH